jgi:hypothetical protein
MVDFISNGVSDGTLYVSVRFTDNTNFFHPLADYFFAG